MPCDKRNRDVIERQGHVSTWREHMELHHPEHVIKLCLVGGATKVCLVDSCIPPSARYQDYQHQGYPEGCRDCRARGIVKNNDGGQLCWHATQWKANPKRDYDIPDADVDDMPELIDVM